MSALPFLTPFIPSLFAYIDPFTGSVLLQVVAAGFLGTMLFFKRIKFFVAGLFCGNAACNTEASDHDIDE
ncbi:MAG: hypothetical protein PHQ75_06435 [Thermoguttaceae bacterium]|nr:hypothetical protein [Thermoguttaceae bacterium]